MSQFETIIYSVGDQIAEIRFNRPDRLNAVIEQFYTDVIAAIDLAEADPEVRIIILTGEGRRCGYGRTPQGSTQRG